MSVVRRVFESRAGASVEVLALLALADAADGDGLAEVSYAEVCRRTRLSRATVKRAMKELRKKGLVEVLRTGRGRGKPTLHRVCV